MKRLSKQLTNDGVKDLQYFDITEKALRNAKNRHPIQYNVAEETAGAVADKMQL